MRIMLVGGGSGGPVSPLLAVAEKIRLRHPKAEFMLVGGKSGPEEKMAAEACVDFRAISSGKWRRYFSWKNFLAPFLALAGFVRSVRLLRAFRPDCVFGAGSFVQVPVVWAAYLLKIPVLIHQQDLVPGLANKLSQFAAKKITVTFKATLSGFPSSLGLIYKKNNNKVVLTGNPFREQLENGTLKEAQKAFGLKIDFPTLLVLGGGTGAEFFNRLIEESLPELLKTVQVIHSTGRGKAAAKRQELYYPFEFLSAEQLANAYAAADIVLARAGLSTITELANLGKMAVIIPMPDSHQDFNAGYLYNRHAAIVFQQKRVKAKNFVMLVRKLIFAQELKQELQHNIRQIMPKGAADKIADEIIKLALKQIA